MCLFPLPNHDPTSPAYRRGITEFECGSCPECLQKRASRWALRGHYECQEHEHNLMVCLTYDQYVHDSRTGRVVGEAVADRSVDKRDIQLFIKRLRKYMDTHYGAKIKYIVSAEYGARTHRPHYHAILFGAWFPDLIPYRKSKRGNLIYTSQTLTRLWKHGICTVDSVDVSGKNIRYCTKYSTKQRVIGSDRYADTFTLSSTRIGYNGLMRDFNGLSYFVDGHEYPVPRFIWERIITLRHLHCNYSFPWTFRYLSARDYGFDIASENLFARRNYRMVRDGDFLYKKYLLYWQNKSAQYDLLRPDIFTRILNLPDSKYFSYKQSAIIVYYKRKHGIPYPAPLSQSGLSRYICYLNENLPRISCHIAAGDTKTPIQAYSDFIYRRLPIIFPYRPPKNDVFQLNLFDNV